MVSPLSLHLHPQLWLLSLCQRQRYLLFLALTSLLSYRLICLSGPISVCTNWNSLSLTPSLFSFPLFPSLVTLSSILLPTANKLSSLRESNSYNLETFYSLFLLQITIILAEHYLLPKIPWHSQMLFLFYCPLSIPYTATRGSILQCKSDLVKRLKPIASIVLWISPMDYKVLDDIVSAD